jgi:hypothetical protein
LQTSLLTIHYEGRQLLPLRLLLQKHRPLDQEPGQLLIAGIRAPLPLRHDDLCVFNDAP